MSAHAWEKKCTFEMHAQSSKKTVYNNKKCCDYQQARLVPPTVQLSSAIPRHSQVEERREGGLELGFKRGNAGFFTFLLIFAVLLLLGMLVWQPLWKRRRSLQTSMRIQRIYANHRPRVYNRLALISTPAVPQSPWKKKRKQSSSITRAGIRFGVKPTHACEQKDEGGD